MVDIPIDKKDVQEIVNSQKETTKEIKGFGNVITKMMQNQPPPSSDTDASFEQVAKDISKGNELIKVTGEKNRETTENSANSTNKALGRIDLSLGILGKQGQKAAIDQRVTTSDETEDQKKSLFHRLKEKKFWAASTKYFKDWAKSQKERLKGAGKGLLTYLGTLLGGGALLALLQFMESPEWKKIKERIAKFNFKEFGMKVERVLTALSTSLSSAFKYFFGSTDDKGKNDGKGLFARIGKVFDGFKEGGILGGIKAMFDNFGLVESAVLLIVGALVLPKALAATGILLAIKLMFKGFGAIWAALKAITGFTSSANAKNLKNAKAAGMSASQLNEIAGAEKGKSYKMGKQTFRYEGQQFVNEKTGRIATKVEAEQLRKGISTGKIGVVGSKPGSRPKVAWAKKFPKMAKFLKLGGPLAAILGGIDAISILQDDKPQKASRLAGVLAGSGAALVGSVIGGALGSVVPGFGTLLGILGGGALGYFAGASAGKGLAQFLLGEKVDAFPLDSINNWLNGKRLSKDVARLEQTHDKLSARANMRGMFFGGETYKGSAFDKFSKNFDHTKTGGFRGFVREKLNAMGIKGNAKLTAQQASMLSRAGLVGVTEGEAVASAIARNRDFFMSQPGSIKRLENEKSELMAKLKDKELPEAERTVIQNIIDSSRREDTTMVSRFTPAYPAGFSPF